MCAGGKQYGLGPRKHTLSVKGAESDTFTRTLMSLSESAKQSRKRKTDAAEPADAPPEKKAHPQTGKAKKTNKFTVEQLALMLAHMSKVRGSKYKAKRDPLLLEFAGRTGFRRMELRMLTAGMMIDVATGKALDFITAPPNILKGSGVSKKVAAQRKAKTAAAKASKAEVKAKALAEPAIAAQLTPEQKKLSKPLRSPR